MEILLLGKYPIYRSLKKRNPCLGSMLSSDWFAGWQRGIPL